MFSSSVHYCINHALSTLLASSGCIRAVGAYSFNPDGVASRIAAVGSGLIAGIKKEAYFAAIQAGMDKNYQPMEKLFAGIIEKSVASS